MLGLFFQLTALTGSSCSLPEILNFTTEDMSVLFKKYLLQNARCWLSPGSAALIHAQAIESRAVVQWYLYDRQSKMAFWLPTCKPAMILNIYHFSNKFHFFKNYFNGIPDTIQVGLLIKPRLIYFLRFSRAVALFYLLGALTKTYSKGCFHIFSEQGQITQKGII